MLHESLPCFSSAVRTTSVHDAGVVAVSEEVLAGLTVAGPIHQAALRVRVMSGKGDTSRRWHAESLHSPDGSHHAQWAAMARSMVRVRSLRSETARLLARARSTACLQDVVQ